MEPFLYPQIKIKRKQTPPQYKDYKPYKKYLKIEFENKCAYCMLPDGIPGSQFFETDHYKPEHIFPLLSAEYTNLFYSCRNCNNSKRGFWPSNTEFNQGLFVLNPCDYKMIDHLRYKGVVVETKTKTGQFTVDVLQLNDEEVIRHRQLIIDNINLYKKELFSLEESRKECAKQLSKKKRFKGRLQRYLNVLDGDIKKFKIYIDQYTGKV